MIKQLAGHLSQKQLNLICDRIIQQYQKYLNVTGTDEYKDVFGLEDYSNHREQNTLARAIMNGFPNGSTIGGLAISPKKDSSGYARPELKNKSIVIHIQSEKFNKSSNYLKPYYQLNKRSFSQKKLYCYLVFKERNNRLMQVTLFLPDDKGKIIGKEILANQQEIMALAS